MNKHRWLIVVLALAGLGAILLFAWPVWQTGTRSDTEAPPAPDFSSTIRVENPRIVLPGADSEAALVFFDLVNLGDRTVALTELRLAHGSDTAMQDPRGPARTPVANLTVAPGETLRLAPGGAFVALTDYDSTVVPGAEIALTLVFGTSATVTVPARVLAAQQARAG